MQQTIGHTILQQLGGGKFIAMTGAKNFVLYPDGLRFDLPARFAAKGINKVHITLTPADLYTVEFMRWNARALELQKIATENDIYADMLPETFRSHTGLETRMPTVYRAR